jgi:hypothetical protein
MGEYRGTQVCTEPFAGSQGFSRLIHWGYVHHLLIQGYVPGWIRFVRDHLFKRHMMSEHD